jgi:hypothetical protein
MAFDEYPTRIGKRSGSTKAIGQTWDCGTSTERGDNASSGPLLIASAGDMVLVL